MQHSTVSITYDFPPKCRNIKLFAFMHAVEAYDRRSRSVKQYADVCMCIATCAFQQLCWHLKYLAHSNE